MKKTLNNQFVKQIVALAILVAAGMGLSIPTTNADSVVTVNASESSNAYLSTAYGTLSGNVNGASAMIGNTALLGNLSPVRGEEQVTDGKYRVARVINVPSSAYNSLPEQTDDSPFISANGSHVYWGMVAANFLDFGTEIRIPDYFGDKVFKVEDRMNRRYDYKIDIWYENYDDAIQWGVRNIRVEILEPVEA